MKRILAFVLTLCLIFALLPTNVVVAAGAEHPNSSYSKAGHGDTSVTWTAINTVADLNKLATSGHYYLADSLTATTKQVLDGVNVTLCLGGKTLSASSALERHFELKNGAHLTICDCTASGTGDEYTAGTVNPGKKKAGIALLYAKGNAAGQTATLTILDGIFDGKNTATGDYCGFIRVEAGSGTAAAAARLDIQGGKFANRRGGRGGAILLSANSNAVATISNAQFVNCGSWQDNGGAITAETGSLTIDNCVFKNNKARNDQSVNPAAVLGQSSGGAIYAKNCQLSITDSTFEGNEAAWAGALFCMTVTGTIKDCTFTGNKSTGTGPSVMHIESSSKITLDGCTITDNVHTAAPPTEGVTGAIDLRAESSTLTLKGATVIDNNTEADGTECNLRMAFAYNAAKRANTTVKVDGLTAGSNVNIYTAKDTREDPNNLLVAGAGQTEWSAGWVRYDNKGKHIQLTGTSFSYADHAHADVIGEWIAWGDDDAEKTSLPTANGNYYLVDNITGSAKYTSNSTVTAGYTQADKIVICLNHHNITAASGKPIFTMTHGANVTVCDCTATGNATDGTYDAGKLIPGACSGGAAYLTQAAVEYPDAVFTMTGGIIDGQGITAAGNGAALWAGAKAAVFDLKDCVIQNCTSESSVGAGAVYASSGPTFSAKNVRFYNNKCTGASGYNGGGAIRFNTFTAATLENCVFDSNQSSARGSAIYMNNTSAGKKLVATDCTFTNNVAKANSTIMVQKGDTELTRCTFTGNIANGTEGASTVNNEGSSVMTLDSCTITGNTFPNATKPDAGATYTSGSSAIVVKGNTVVDNNTKKDGVEENIYICNGGGSGTADRGYLNVDGLTEGANISVATPSTREPATTLVKLATGGAQTTWGDTWVQHENNGLYVGYPSNVFTYLAPVVTAHEAHHNCACVLENSGTTGCTHTDADKVDYQPWDSATTLPTSGNYYLTKDVKLAAAGDLSVAAGTTLNLCLNGYTIDFQVGTGTTCGRYNVAAGATLNIINCKAKLDSKGLLQAGDKERPSVANAGRITGGKGQYGSAIYAAGTVNAYGINFYGNGVDTGNKSCGVIYLNDNKSTVTVKHSRFDSNKGTFGAVGTYTGGALTLHDTVLTKNSGASGGAIYYRSRTTVANPTIVISGDSQFTENTATGSGGAIYATVGGNGDTAAQLGSFKPVMITLQDNAQITNNTSGATSKGALAVDAGNGADNSVVTVSGNVKVADNKGATGKPDIFLASRGRVAVGEITDEFKLNIATAALKTDPDEFMLKVATLADTADLGVTYSNNGKIVGYNSTENFYFYDPAAAADHFHHACACAIEGGSCAGHGTEAELGWVAWTDNTKLPTATGNYYLTGDIELTNTAAMNIAGGVDVKLCLNGYSIKFNENWSGGANYYVYAGNNLTIMNCQAKLDANGMYACGNKTAPTDAKAGRLYNGNGLYGGAIYVKGECNLIGVEMSDNKANHTTEGFGGAIRVQDGGRLNISHSKLANNTAKSNGGAISTGREPASTVVLNKTILSGNTSSTNGGAVYLDVGSNLQVTDCVITENKAGSCGGAIATRTGKNNITIHNTDITNNTGAYSGGIYIRSMNTIAPVNATITGKCNITGNKSTAGSGGAIYVCVSDTATNANANNFKPVNLTLDGDITISGNSSNGANGAVAFDASFGAEVSYLTLGGNVVVKDNITTKTRQDVSLGAKGMIKVGQMGDKAEVYVTNATMPGDPDQFMLAKDANTKESNAIGIHYKSGTESYPIGYSKDTKVQFYFSSEVTHNPHAVCVCAINGDTTCKHDDSLTWTPWVYGNQLPTTTGNYYLTQDIVVTSDVGGSIGVFEVKDGQKVNLCMNGFSIKFSEKNNSKANYYAMQGSELSIINCKAKLDKNNHLVPGESGKITNGRGLYGGALYSKGKLTLIGIELSNNMVAATQSQNAIANSYGGAVRIQSGGILRTISCLFQDNKALYHGGAIAVGQGDAEVYLHDTVLKNNEAIGVYTKTEKIDGKTVTTVSPTKDDDGFKLDEAKGRGGALYFNVNHLSTAGNGVTKQPVLEISGNTLFQGNITNAESGGQGGAIAIATPSTNGFNLKVTIKDNVQILDNTSRATGGAIYINQGNAKNAPEITICDNVKISGNKSLAGNGGAIYANITVKAQTPIKLDITDNVQITGNQTPKGNGGAIYMQHITTGDPAVITLSGNAKISGNKTMYTGGGIQLNGGFVLNITENAEISNNISGTYSGGIHATKHSAGEKGVTINITGGKIAKNEAMGKLDAKTGKMKEGYGGGIYIKQGAINMTGGTIAENRANYGGGVFFNTTKFTFTKGTITKNFAKTNGGGISSSQFSEFIMNGAEAVVCYNTTEGPAGGILIQGRKTSELDGKKITKDYGTTMTMTSGKVYGNVAQKQGGGIYVSTDSRAIIRGGYITGNESVKETGGGMYESKGEILVYGGYFANNKCFHAGGAIQASEGKLHIYGGTFENNECKYGAAFRTYNFTDTYVENATFINNHAINMGGAIALQSDTVIKNCTFKGNTALRAEGATNECDGGAVYVWGGDTYNRPSYEVTIEDCLFEENECETLGGAVGVGHNCTLTINDSVFKNNKSRDRGGAVSTVNGRTQRQKIVHLNVNNCEFVGNEAVNDGGAVYNTWIAETHLNNSTFTDNVAGRDGGAFASRKQSDTFIDGCEFTGNTAGLRASAIFLGDNVELSNITVTGNKSGDAYAVYFDEGGYDGDSYIRALIKFYGDIIVKDNEGSKADMFIAKKALVNIGYQGLGDKTEFNVELAEGVLTNTILGEYDYEGGNLKYTVTKGNRSVTEPEAIPVETPDVDPTEPDATEPQATEPGAQSAGLGIGGIIGISAALVVAVIAVLVGVAVGKKKKAGKTAKDTVQE